VERYRTTQRGGVFSHEQLLCSIAQKDPVPETAAYILTELKKVRDAEQKLRDNLRMEGLAVQIMGNTAELLASEPSQCKICRYDCYLSSVNCSCSPQYLACLHHAALLCDCEMKKKVIQVRVPMNIIDDLIAIVEKKQHKKPTHATGGSTFKLPITPEFPTKETSTHSTTTNANTNANKSHVFSSNYANGTSSKSNGNVMILTNGNGTTSPISMKPISEQISDRRSTKEAPEKLYQNKIPPPPSIPTTPPITYTSVSLTDLTTPTPTTRQHLIPTPTQQRTSLTHSVAKVIVIDPTSPTGSLDSKPQPLKIQKQVGKLKTATLPVNPPERKKSMI